ncbi:MAG: DUF3089 domain-containing protein [Chitinophagaceae bacterium]
MAISKYGTFVIFGLVTFIIVLNNSCSPKYTPYTGEKSFKSETGKPDYAQLNYWAAHPDKWDPSDSISLPLKTGLSNKDADVFFLHPTSFTDEKFAYQPNARIDDSLLNKKTDYTSILYQASVFNGSCRIYAPRYRQAHLQMYYNKDTAKAKAAFELAYQDIKSAFNYFLKTQNNGRPIIIASHSQGTTHAKRLLKELFDGTVLSKQLVVAYILGIPVEKNYFSTLPLCKDTTATGCYISWRTYRKGYEEGAISSKDTTIAVINPYLWTPENELAKKHLQKGAVLYNFNKVYRHTQSSQIVGNSLWISKPKFPGGFFYFTKNYHAGDFNLFYIDIREDIARRINQFKEVQNNSHR